MENIITIKRKKINYFKLFCLLAFLMPFFFLSAKTDEMKQEVLSIALQNKTIGEVFSYIEKNSNYVFIYEGSVDLNRKVDVNIANKPVEEIIKEVFSSNGFTYVIKGRQIIVKKQNVSEPSTKVSTPISTQKELVVHGTVTDHSGLPLVGVNVIAKGTTTGTVTDIDGNFELQVSEEAVLQFSYIGYKNHEMKARGQMTIVLNEDNELLDEVVVVGYGTQKKVNMTGAVSSVKMGALNDRPVTNATNALAGLAAGLAVTNNGGNTPGYESQTIRIRGQGTLNDSSPLVVIDGMAGASISDINPQDIENISILKDAASSAIYGSRAANGVILITTKKGAEGNARITYSGNVSFETVAKRLNLVTDYADFMEIQNAGLLANGQAARFSQGKIDEWRNDAGKNPTVYPNTDWQDHIYRNPSVVQNHTLSAIGGSKTTRYNLSFGYINNPGMIYHTNYERYQLRTNVDVDIKPWLSVGTNIFGYLDTNDPSSDNAAAGGDVIWGYGAFGTVPGMTLYDSKTGFYGGIQNPEEENVSNA
ncbi:MAG: SusC/RagA family TonB-linked outer membrane protein, partial [Massilibacteroides sp.]|nr:SusC/RagA family TonB-linked outer membrane protein [Massilibacteroides sp.]